MYYLVKRYFLPDAVWVRAPHFDPIGYSTWGEAADAYIQTRLSNVRVLGVPGYPAANLDIEYVSE